MDRQRILAALPVMMVTACMGIEFPRVRQLADPEPQGHIERRRKVRKSKTERDMQKSRRKMGWDK